MKKHGFFVLLCSSFLMIAFLAVGCGGGGGSGNSDSNPTAQLTVSNQMTSYDYGNVTVGSSSAPMEVTVCNTGDADLTVSDLILSDMTNFYFDMSGSEACSSPPYTIAAGGCCTLSVSFEPTEIGSYSELLTIITSDADLSSYEISLAGTGTAVQLLSVNLNQIDAVFFPNITAYVTVTDQNGFLVGGLEGNPSNFQITENGSQSFAPASVVFASEAALSIASTIILDYSYSVTSDQGFVENMENGSEIFIDQLGSSDQAEIIKFADETAVVQGFTSNKNDLIAALLAPKPDIGTHTALYDAIFKGIQDAALTTANRRAVIVLTDGVDNDGTGARLSEKTAAEVIALAQTEGVPVFTIAVGDADQAVLKDIADSTGGKFYTAPTFDRLGTIYLQLSQILHNQYVLSYRSSEAGPGNVTVTVSVPHDVPQTGVVGDDSDPLTY